MTIKGDTYKGKKIEQPIVISTDFEYDVSFIDVIGERHNVLNLKKNGIAKAVFTALKLKDLSINDIEKTSITIFKHGTYTLLQPKKDTKKRVEIEMLQKVVAKMFRVNNDNSIVELKVTPSQWAPFSKYSRIQHTEEGMKKIMKEVAIINAKNKNALLKKKFAK